MNIRNLQRGSPEKSPDKYVASLVQFYQKIAHLPGDIIELGVAKGRNTFIFGHLIAKTGRRYYGFDTFKGYMPDDLKQSPNLIKSQKSGRWKNDPYKLRKALDRYHLTKCCKIIVGDIKETIPKFIKNRNQHVALLYIDCNAYLPAITALRALQKNFQKGTIICVDEHRVGGETRALKEFAEDNQLDVIETNDGIGIPKYVTYAKPAA